MLSLIFSVILYALFTKWRSKPILKNTREDSIDSVSNPSEIKPKKIKIMTDKKWEAVAKELSTKSIHMMPLMRI